MVRLSVGASCSAEMENRRIHLASGGFWTYVAVVAVFILLGGEFDCTCRPQVFDCHVYLVLPVVIVFLLILWTDGSFQSVCRHLCSGAARRTQTHTSGLLGSFCYHITRALFIGLLWIVLVLVDGDWFVCCQNDGSKQQQQLACKSVVGLSEEERVTIADLRNRSKAIGSFLLLAIVGGPALLASLGWRRRSTENLLEQLILEEEDQVLEEVLRTSARETLTREIEDRRRRNRWEEGSDVAASLITSEENSPGPGRT